MSVYTVKATLGWREYTEKFGTCQNAAKFVRKLLGDDKPKWKSTTCFVAKAKGALSIESDVLEEIMEASDKGTLHDAVAEKVKKFLFGVWKNEEDAGPAKEGESSPKKVKKAAVDGGGGAWRKEGHVSLIELCKENGWSDKHARRVLRKAGVKNEGRWSFAKNDAEMIKHILRKVQK